MNNKPSRIISHLKTKSRVLWSLLAVLSIAPLFPLSSFVGHAHWDHIRWIPFQDFSLSWNMLKDVMGNTFWFMMFGYLLHHQLNEDQLSCRLTVTIIAIAASVSVAAEFFQVFCHNRTPAMTDVTCNVLGAGLGGYIAQKQYTATATEPSPPTWGSNLVVHKRFNGFPRLYRQHLPLD